MEIKPLRSKYLTIAVLAVWTMIWIGFFARGMAKGKAEEYKALFGKTIDEKRAFVFGRGFYEFMKFCGDALPAGSRYHLEGNMPNDLAQGAMRYFLHPVLPSKDKPDYILCYDTDYAKSGFSVFARLDSRRYILKRK